MTNMTGAAIPARQMTTTRIKQDTTIENRLETRYVFFPGDTIEPMMKFRMPDRAFGGLLADGFQTLKHNGNPGIVYQCRITALQPAFRGVNKAFIDPAVVDSWVKSYVIQTTDANGNPTETEVSVPHMVFKQVYPADDCVRMTTARSQPNGEDGVVELTALRGQAEDFASEVQLFFFPDWIEIERGEKGLPGTLDDIERLLQSRLRAVDVEIADPRMRLLYGQAGREMLGAVQKYRNWGLQYLKDVEDQFNLAKSKGVPFSYPPKAEMLLVQLKQVRKDELAASNATSNADLVAALMEQNRLNRELLEIEKAKLGVTTATSAPVVTTAKAAPVAAPVPDLASSIADQLFPADEVFPGSVPPQRPASAPAICADFTANGEPCKGAVSHEINGVGYCRHHPKDKDKA